MGSGKNPNVNPVFDIARNPPRALIDRIRTELKKRGMYGIRGLAVAFRRADKNKNGVLDRAEFTWALKELGFNLTKNELDNLFRYFDKNFDDQVSYVEFIKQLRPALNARR